ncbi:MAG: hypothetical protein CMN93_08135 [Synechococcus sp. CPC35]|nr:hypothetical protein [Synechococcus sp. CPC35]
MQVEPGNMRVKEPAIVAQTVKYVEIDIVVRIVMKPHTRVLRWRALCAPDEYVNCRRRNAGQVQAAEQRRNHFQMILGGVDGDSD